MTSPPILSARHYAWITLAFVIFVIYGSLVPLAAQSVPLDKALDRFGRAFTQSVQIAHRSDWLANILLFIPLGFFGMGWQCVDRAERSSRRYTYPARFDRRSIVVISLLLISFVALSSLIEFVQIWFPPRHTSINDVAAETLGGMIGIAIWLIAGQATTNYVRRFWMTHADGNWAIRLIPGYLVVLVIAQGMPFDLTLSPSVLGRKLRDGRVLAIPFSLTSGEPLDIVRKALVNFAYFVPAGLLIAGLPGRIAIGRNAGWRALGLGFCLACAIEAMQMLVFTRYFDTTDIITGSIAVLVGWNLMRMHLSETDFQHGRSRRSLLFLAWVAALVFINWEPFDFTTDSGLLNRRWSEASFVPFADYYAGNYLLSFSAMLDKTLLFVPFGLLLVSTLDSRGPWLVVVSALLLALLLEAGQFFLWHHTPGISDLILEPIGAWLGCLIAPRLGLVSQLNSPEAIFPQADGEKES